MRKAIRLALPVVAATTALVLTGCNDDDGEGAFGSIGGNSGGSEETTEDSGGTTGGEETGDTGTTGGGEETGDTGTTGGDTGGATGPAPTIEEITGDWFTEASANAANLEINSADDIKFYSSFNPSDSDYCTGTYADGVVSLNDCTNIGGDSWGDMSATITLEGGAMTATWSSGTTMSLTEWNSFSVEEQTSLSTIFEDFNNALPS